MTIMYKMTAKGEIFVSDYLYKSYNCILIKHDLLEQSFDGSKSLINLEL